MMEHSLLEVLEEVTRDSWARDKTPGQMAERFKPWLTNRIDMRHFPGDAPLMLHRLADRPFWDRFAYSFLVMRSLSCAHYLLRAADHLNGLEDLQASLFLIVRARTMLQEILKGLER